MQLSPSQITYLILAGGRGSRMNGIDKGLMQWQDKLMIEHIMQHLHLNKDNTIISANRHQLNYQKYATTVVADAIDDYQGPLAGILSAMKVCTTPYLLCVPCDCPAPPDKLLMHLSECMQQQQKDSAICHDGERLQPLFALLSTHHLSALASFLQQGHRKVTSFMQKIDPAICNLSQQHEKFINFNKPDDIPHD